MATPDIGTTISEAYSRGLDRVGPAAGALVVPAAIIGATYALSTIVQESVVKNTFSDAFSAALSGRSVDGLSFVDRLALNGSSAFAGIVSTFVLAGAIAMVAGAFRRERNGEPFELPGPGESIAAVRTQMSRLMPRLGLLAGLGVVGSLAGILSSILGGLVSFIALVVLVVVGVRWMYAPVVSGTGEATGVAAYDRSEEMVSGSWWATLGVWFVIMLALLIPIGIIAGIIGAVIGSVSGPLGAFASYMVFAIAYGLFGAAALESGWTQLSSAGPTDGSQTSPAPGTTSEPATDPPSTDAPGHNGPFV